jgi:hypothetical protein
MSLPERARSIRWVATLVLLVPAIGGCGKGNLPAPAQIAAAPAHRSPLVPRSDAPVRIPLQLDATLARKFANAVNLRLADVIGANVQPRSTDPEQEHEAGKCGAGASVPLGGARAPKLDRGAGLEHETISSSVVVLSSERAARADFSYASSKAGIKCYGNVLSKSLQGQAGTSVQVGHVRLSRMQLQGPRASPSSGIRITARVSSSSGGLSVPLFIDAVGFIYGPAEIELYATSFVQPEPQRTELQLLTLLERRALQRRL